MKVKDILLNPIVDYETEIYIRSDIFTLLASGNWYEDDISYYNDYDAESFTYEDEDNKLYIDIKDKGNIDDRKGDSL